MRLCLLVALSFSLLDAPAASALGFDEALTASARTPGVEGTRQALRVRSEQDSHISAATGNPEINVAPGMAVTGGVGPELQASAQQSWNLAGLGEARRGAAKREREALAVEIRARALNQRLMAGHAWLGLWTTQQMLAQAQRELVLAQEFETTVARAAARGQTTMADAADAKAWRGEVAQRAVRLEGDQHDLAVLLAHEVGLPPEPLATADGAPPEPGLPDRATWHAAAANAQNLPEALLRRLEAVAQKARSVEAEAMHGSAFSLGAALQRDAAGRLVIAGTFGLRWSAFDRGQRVTSQAAAETERARADESQANLDAAHRLSMAWHEVEHTREEEAVLRDILAPAVAEALRLRTLAFTRGAATVFDVLRSRREALEANRRLTELRGARTWAEIKAWMLYAELVAGGGERSAGGAR